MRWGGCGVVSWSDGGGEFVGHCVGVVGCGGVELVWGWLWW